MMDLREARGGPVAQRHPWEIARATLVGRELHVIAQKISCRPSVLDYGAGDCFLASMVATRLRYSQFVCFDQGYTPEEMPKISRRLPYNIRLTTERPTIGFDVVLLLDVLEHLRDDAQVLREISTRNLLPGGYLILTVPAIPTLYSDHDSRLGHYRRYSRDKLLRIVAASGLEVVKEGGLFSSLVIPRAIQYTIERAVEGRGVVLADEFVDRGGWTSVENWKASAYLTKGLAWLLSRELQAEAWLASLGIGMVGLSHLVIARREK